MQAESANFDFLKQQRHEPLFRLRLPPPTSDTPGLCERE
jgi:hypothetical protein